MSQHTFLDADSMPGIPLGQLTTVGSAASPITHGASFVSAHPIAALLTASVQHAPLPVYSAVSASTMRSIVSAVAVAVAALSNAHTFSLLFLHQLLSMCYLTERGLPHMQKLAAIDRTKKSCVAHIHVFVAFVLQLIQYRPTVYSIVYTSRQCVTTSTTTFCTAVAINAGGTVVAVKRARSSLHMMQ
jgi:hypothetical protein